MYIAQVVDTVLKMMVIRAVSEQLSLERAGGGKGLKVRKDKVYD